MTPLAQGTPANGPAPLVQIGDLSVHDLTFGEAVDRIWQMIEGSSGGVVCTPNADYVVRARRNLEFRSAIQAADLRVPDGMWIVYASRIAGRPLRGTVTGRLLLSALAERAAAEGRPIALFGAQSGVAAAAGRRLQARVAGLRVAAAVSPPAGLVIGSADDKSAVDQLRRSDPAIVFVALGAPKQEIWMARHRGDFPDAVLIGVGAAFDIEAGRFRTAPRWMTNVGLEWLFRLMQEPRRLARRYLLDDPWIIRWAIGVRLRRRRGPETAG